MSGRAPDPPLPPDPELVVLQGDRELARTFFAETFDHLSSIEGSVLALEATPHDQTALNDLFRPFHSLKANAGALGITSIEQLAHRIEHLLDRARAGLHRIGPAEIEVVLTAVDVLTVMLRDLQGRLEGEQGTNLRDRVGSLLSALEHLGVAYSDDHGSGAVRPVPEQEREPSTATSATPGLPDRQATVKVDMSKLDNLVDLAGELAIVQSMIQRDSAQGKDHQRLQRNLAQLQRLTAELQRGSMSMRLVPIRQTFQRMSRLVRDLSHKSGKPLELTVSGEDTELDRKVVEELADPLMHMVRNSVDHGIEDAETRRRAGKPPQGHLSLSAYHQGGNVIVAVADDGRGLDTEALYRRAVKQKVIEPGVPLTEADIHALIFRPGFSTASEVTEISGRGIGMDVVRRHVETLRGRIEIRSKPGNGATFLIKVPLTLATVEGLILGVGTERFVLPTFAVRESFRPARERISQIPGRGSVVQVRDEVLPLVHLGNLFGVAASEADPCNAIVVVIEDDLQRAALMVDQLIGKQEIVIKTLGDYLAKITGVAGGAILADGRISLILEAGELVRLHRERSVRVA